MLITQNQVFLIAFSPGFVAMPVMRPRKMRAALFLDTEDGNIIIIIIITVLITHYAKPQCVYKYEYRQLYITITIIYYKYVHVCNRYKIKQYSICNYSV